MTERLGYQKEEKKLKEQVRQMKSTCKQLSIEVKEDRRQVQKISQKLARFSNSFLQDKRLSESVDLDQSRLESFLNNEKETKQGLLCEVNQKKRHFHRQRSINKSCTSHKFISSDMESASDISFNDSNFDFVDIISESKPEFS